MEHKVSNELPPIPNGSLPEQMSQSVAPGAETLRNQAFESGQGAPVQTKQPPAQITMPQQAPLAQPLMQQPATAVMPTIADDTDLIEKEWVEKAKEIVARTRHDPHQQNKEVERMKADYMKKRYNKDIKITEE